MADYAKSSQPTYSRGRAAGIGVGLIKVSVPPNASKCLLSAQKKSNLLHGSLIPDAATTRSKNSWTVLKTSHVGEISDSIGFDESEPRPCEGNGDFSTSTIV